ncbi:hypothetical protein F442_10866 [Phytophthora nicotianae P10297]|nr:hypothetical protein F442_10866 [Phytophthora nicotianae P10297]
MRISRAPVLVVIATITTYVEVSPTKNEKGDYLPATKSISSDSTLQYFKDAQEKIDKEVNLVFSDDEERESWDTRLQQIELSFV